MTAGQQAMAKAKLYPEPKKGGKGKRSQIYEGLDSKDKRQSQNAISQARTVLRWLPEIADMELSRGLLCVGTQPAWSIKAVGLRLPPD